MRKLLLLLFACAPLFCEELIVYRPQNSDNINSIRCWIKIEDENGNDVTHTAARAAYAYMDRPFDLKWYRKSFYLEGAMAAHLYLNKGKYKISVFTPRNQVEGLDISETLKTDWNSDFFIYDSDIVENSLDKKTNPLHVIFVSPVCNENSFYLPQWHIDYKSPVFLKDRYPIFTKPLRTDSETSSE